MYVLSGIHSPGETGFDPQVHADIMIISVKLWEVSLSHFLGT